MSDKDEMDEVIQEFLVESSENLDQLDNDLLALEENPSDPETMASIFRTIHTIKGTCGFLGFEKLEKVSHIGENLLSKLREGELRLDEKRTNVLLKMVDAIRQMLASIESTGADGDGNYTELVEMLTSLQEDTESAGPVDAAEPDSAGEQKSDPIQVAEPDQKKTVKKPAGEALIITDEVEAAQVAEAVKQQSEGDKRAAEEILVQQDAINEGPSEDPRNQAAVDIQQESKAHAPTAAASNIRVDVGLLDKLMNLVGELVLARNQMLQFNNTLENVDFTNASQRLSLVTTELQEKVMQTRMQPIGGVWGKFPRVVRDLAHGCGKQVRIIMEGKETELDKTLIEAIKDPLTHLVRNSVDHGIEMPDVRTAHGKPAEGTLLLRAFHEGGQVNIEICDDGAGIDIERLKKKAVSRGQMSEGQMKKMGDREAMNLIFRAGLSTAEKVSNISGRGVGMDVVKTNIEKIGGVIEIQSKPEEGTTIRIKIPLTLAIIPALTVLCDNDYYAIPQVNVMELVLLEGEQARKGIESIHGAPVYRLRGNLLPLVSLRHELWGSSEAVDAPSDTINIIVLQAGEQRFGLIVDEVDDMQEIVVKPLGKQLNGIACFAGATIMGDGTVAMILDGFGLAKQASLISEAIHEQVAKEQASRTGQIAKDKQMLVLMQNPDGGRIAVSLSEVARLEELSKSSIEVSGRQDVICYRDQIMPLIDVAKTLPERRDPSRLKKAEESIRSGKDTDTIQVVVHSHDGHTVGLVVDQIIDVAEENLSVKGEASRSGTLGTAVIQGRVTELLDIEVIVRMADVGSEQQPQMAQGA